MSNEEIQEYLLNRLAYQHTSMIILVSIIGDLCKALGKEPPSFEHVFNDSVKGIQMLTTEREYDGPASKHDVLITRFGSELGQLKLNMKKDACTMRTPSQGEGNEED